MTSQLHPFNLTNPNFPYTPANKTDVTKTWKAHGWTPPSTVPGYFEERRKALMEQMSYEEFPV